MSNTKPRNSDHVRETRPTHSRRKSRGNPGYSDRSSDLPSLDKRGHWMVWGKSPNYRLDQRGLTQLFQEQNRLKAALLRQSRLAKLAVEDVRSTEAERLRTVNERIVHASSTLEGSTNPFASRNISSAQKLSEEMLRSLGRRFRQTKSAAPPPVKPSLPKRHTKVSPSLHSGEPKPLTELTVLTGPLLPDFRRAVERGYQGSPSQWLRGPIAARGIARLRSKGIACSGPRLCSVFDRNSPLRYKTFSGCLYRNYGLRHGFHGEALYLQGDDASTLVRQARSVPRLSKKQWPRINSRTLWPAHPTLHESWEMLMRGVKPQRKPGTTLLKWQGSRLPTRSLPKGAAARVISRNVIGIRADIPLPVKLLAYFKYRWGFLILDRKGNHPAELTRFLVSSWKRNYTAMLLYDSLRYNDALRRMPASKFYSLAGFVPGRPDVVAPRSTAARMSRHRRSIVRLIHRRKSPSLSSSVGSDSHNESDRGVRLS